MGPLALFRLGDSASQTAVDENMARYARVAASYINKLEAKAGRKMPQPPSEHLRAAAKASSALPEPAPTPAPAEALPKKMNSLTHRAEYMKLVSRPYW